ncbi:hypothetical protein RFI_25503, partial [Reticulomyxa filosa]
MYLYYIDLLLSASAFYAVGIGLGLLRGIRKKNNITFSNKVDEYITRWQDLIPVDHSKRFQALNREREEWVLKALKHRKSDLSYTDPSFNMPCQPQNYPFLRTFGRHEYLRLQEVMSFNNGTAVWLFLTPADNYFPEEQMPLYEKENANSMYSLFLSRFICVFNDGYHSQKNIFFFFSF